jgi:hypothetical protein
LEPNVNGSDRRGLRGVIAGKRSERLKIPDPEAYFYCMSAEYVNGNETPIDVNQTCLFPEEEQSTKS